MAQFARPVSTLVAGLWDPVGGPSTLWECLDEVSADDGDYIEALNGENTTCELGLSTVTDPVSNTGHTIRFRMQSAGSGQKERCEVELYDGASLIATTGIQIDRAGWQDKTYTLTSIEADNIGNYADLRLKIITSNLDATEDMWVSWAEFEVPDAAAGSQIVSTLEANHIATAATTTFAQVHAIFAGEANHAVTIATTILAQVHAFAVGEANHVVTAATTTFAQFIDLPSNESNHTHQSDRATLFQSHIFVVGEANYAQQSDGAAFIQTHLLVVGEINHVQQSDDVLLQVSQTLAMDEVNHVLQSDTVTLIQTYKVMVASAVHAQQSDTTLLAQIHELQVADAVQAQQSDASTYVVGHNLVPADAAQAIVSNVAAFVEAQTLITAGAVHSQRSDNTIVSGVSDTGNPLRIFSIAAPGSRQLNITARTNRNIAV